MSSLSLFSLSHKQLAHNIKPDAKNTCFFVFCIYKCRDFFLCFKVKRLNLNLYIRFDVTIIHLFKLIVREQKQYRNGLFPTGRVLIKTLFTLFFIIFYFRRNLNIFSMESEILSFKNPVFRSYAYWNCILVLKCLFLSVFTVLFRVKNKVSAFVYRTMR